MVVPPHLFSNEAVEIQSSDPTNHSKVALEASPEPINALRVDFPTDVFTFLVIHECMVKPQFRQMPIGLPAIGIDRCARRQLLLETSEDGSLVAVRNEPDAYLSRVTVKKPQDWPFWRTSALRMLPSSDPECTSPILPAAANVRFVCFRDTHERIGNIVQHDRAEMGDGCADLILSKTGSVQDECTSTVIKERINEQ